MVYLSIMSQDLSSEHLLLHTGERPYSSKTWVEFCYEMVYETALKDLLKWSDIIVLVVWLMLFSLIFDDV